METVCLNRRKDLAQAIYEKYLFIMKKRFLQTVAMYHGKDFWMHRKRGLTIP